MKHTTLKQVLCGLLSGVLVLSSLCACSSKKSLTADEIIASMTAATESATSLALTIEQDFSYTVDGEDCSTLTTMYMEATTDPEASYLSLTMELELFSFTYDLYSFREGDEYITYMDLDGYWTVSTSDASEIEELTEVADIATEVNVWTLQEDTVELNGSTCYVLTGNLTDESVSTLLGAAYDIDLDLTETPIEEVLYVDSTTFLPVRAVCDLSEVILPVLTALFSEEEIEEVEIVISSYAVTIDYSSFNEIAEIVLPDEAATAEDLFSDADFSYPSDYDIIEMGEDSYILACYDDEGEILSTLCVITPDCCTYDEDYSYMSLGYDLNSDNDAFSWGYAIYSPEFYYTEDTIAEGYGEVITFVYGDYADYYDDCTVDIYSDVTTLTVGELTVCYLGADVYVDGIVIQDYYAWTSIDGSCITVELYLSGISDTNAITTCDILGTDLNSLMTELFEAIVA